MHVFELAIPGTWLQGLADPAKREADALLRLLGHALEDAAIALSLFELAYAKGVPPDVPSKRRQRERDRETAIRNRLAAALPLELAPQQRIEAEMNLYEIARVEAKRERWSAGEWPESYRNRLPFLYAKMFVYALDTLRKAIARLAAVDGVPDLSAAISAWDQQLPDLVHVRDSAHHVEDRVQGKLRTKPIATQPIINAVFNAPQGGILVIDGLIGNRFGGTLADGRYGEVAVSGDTLATAGRIVQSVLNAFTWTGPPERRPR